MFKQGDKIQWTSSGTKRVGEVLGIVTENNDLLNFLIENATGVITKSSMKAQSTSLGDRYVIRVVRGKTKPGKMTQYDYFAPMVKTIDGKSNSAGKSYP